MRWNEGKKYSEDGRDESHERVKIASERARRQSQEYSEKGVEGVEPKIVREAEGESE